MAALPLAKRRYHEYASAVGEAVAAGRATTAVASTFGCTRAFARYWHAKAIDPLLHAQPHGGRRRARFSEQEEMTVHVMLWQEVRANPLRSNGEFAAAMQRAGVTVSALWVGRTFRRWRLSRKQVSEKAVNKFQLSNIMDYG